MKTYIHLSILIASILLLSLNPLSVIANNYLIHASDFTVLEAEDICIAEPQFEAIPLIGTPEVMFQDYSTGSGIITDWFWDFGEGNTSTDQNPTHFFWQPETYPVCLTVTNDFGTTTCQETICLPVDVCMVSPYFTHSPIAGTLDVAFADDSNGYGDVNGTFTYDWDLGDGNTSTAPSFTHTYATAGTYNVCVTVTDQVGGAICQEFICQTVTLAPVLCEVMAEFDAIPYPSTPDVDFIDQSTGNGALSWFWDFNNGFTSTAQNPSTEYWASGTYPVCLTTSNALGCDETICKDVDVCFVDAAFTVTQQNGTNTFDFTDNSFGAGSLSYSWDFGDGNGTSNAQNPTYTYTTPGTYTACVLVTEVYNGLVCDELMCHIVEVAPSCNVTANFGATPTPGFPDVAFQDQSTGAGTLSWLWDFGDGSGMTSTDQNPVHIFPQSGIYNVCLTTTSTDTNGGPSCSETICHPLEICFVYADFSFNQTPGTTDIAFTSTTNGAGPYNYAWDFGDGNTSGDFDPTHTYTAPGDYNVCLTVFEQVGGTTCDFTECHLVNVAPTSSSTTCTANADFNWTLINFGTTQIQFESTSTGTDNVVSWLWDFDDAGAQAINQFPVHLFSNYGTYNVCLTVTYESAGQTCDDTYCETITLAPLCIVDASFDWEFEPLGITQIQFEGTSTGTGTVISRFWDFGDGGQAINQFPIYPYSAPGTYTVCLTVTYDNAGVQCTDTYCEDITVPACNITTDFIHVPLGSIPGVPELPVEFIPNVTGAASNSITNYSWSYGDGAYSNLSDPHVHLYMQDGTYTVELNITNIDANGILCTANYTETITIDYNNISPTCTADADFIWGVGGQPNEVIFTNISNTNPSSATVSYDWDFGDGTSDNQEHPIHVFPSDGLYDVCLTVMVDTGTEQCFDTSCNTVEIITDCLLNANFSHAFITGSTTQVQFTDNSFGTGVLSYDWDFGDGNTSTDAHPLPTFAPGNTYNVCLTLTNTTATETCTDLLCTTITIDAQCTYAIADLDVACQGAMDTVCVWLDAIQPVPNGVIGLDYCINYDPTMMYPSMHFTLGDVVLNNGTLTQGTDANASIFDDNAAGKVHLSIFYNNAYNFSTTTGEVVCVEFVLTNALPANTTIPLSACEVRESYVISEVEQCAEDGTITILDANFSNGELVFWQDASIKLTDDALGSLSNTTIIGTDATCTPNTFTPPIGVDSNGNFNYDTSYGDYVTITRDIAPDDFFTPGANNCAPVMAAINGMDCTCLAWITNFDDRTPPEACNFNANGLPNAYQMIAADVNMNDMLSAGDISLIKERIERERCEFPQAWNYTTDGVPATDYAPSLDWRFIDANTVATSPDFQAHANYPEGLTDPSDLGYWRDNVPDVPACLPTCTSDPSGNIDCCTDKLTYQGILLGDVNGSYMPNSNLRTRASGNLLIDLTQAEGLGNNRYQIPISVSTTDTFYAVDMTFEFDGSSMLVDEIQSSTQATDDNFNMTHNITATNEVILTSYTLDGTTTDAPLYYLIVENVDMSALNIDDFGSVAAYINGMPAEITIQATVLSGGVEVLKESELVVYPNPVKDVANVKVSGVTNLQGSYFNIVDLEGRLLQTITIESNANTHAIDVSALKTGVYILSYYYENEDKVKVVAATKLVKQ